MMAKIARSLSSTVTLNDGVVMPFFGLGTGPGADVAQGYYSTNREKILAAMVHGLQLGYTMLDSAKYYLNEEEAGQAIKAAGKKREDVFLVSKVWKTHRGKEETTLAVEDSLQRFDTNYIDLYMIHSPHEGRLLETYDALLDMKAKGCIRSVGVSNFGIQHIEGLTKAGRPPPSVNQIELNPFLRQDDVVKYCQDKGIVLMAYCPLARNHKHEDPTIKALAGKYGKTTAQVLIRWSVQKGYVAIPKSLRPERIMENSQVFDWQMSLQDMDLLVYDTALEERQVCPLPGSLSAGSELLVVTWRITAVLGSVDDTMAKVAETLSSTVTLNDGTVMPLFGLGTGRGSTMDPVAYVAQNKDKIPAAILFALQHGYSMVDTAAFYRVEEDVGQAIKDSGLKREAIFVVSKLLPTKHGRDATISAFHASLERLGTQYVDMYLIHSPRHGKLVETYDALLELKQQGLIRSVGVSNFDIQHLEELIRAGRPLPSVNQIELHPFHRQEDLVKFCSNHGIALMGSCPVARAERLEDDTIKSLSERYKKTPAQVMIRWSVQKGYITIPKSLRPEHIVENSQVFDWQLSQQDLDLLDTMPNHPVATDYNQKPWTE